MSDFKLGKLAATRPHGLRDLVEYSNGPLPTPPASVALPNVTAWEMFANGPDPSCTVPGAPFGDCVAEDTMVETLGGATAAFRMTYSGPMVQFRVGDKRLTVTPNHAVLTPHGFVPARLLREGGYVISGSLRKAVTPGVEADLKQVPALAQDVFAALHGVDLAGHEVRHVVPRPTDFDGDAQFFDGQVEVVSTDRQLPEGTPSALAEPQRQAGLGAAVALSEALHGQRAGDATLVGIGCAPTRLEGVSGDGRSLRDSHPFVGEAQRFGLWPHHDSLLDEMFAQTVDVDPEAFRYSNQSVATSIRFEGRDGNGARSLMEETRPLAAPPGLYASRHKPAADGAPTDPGLASEILHWFAGDIAAEKVTEVRHLDSWSGHVYDFSTATHWYLANGIVSHNCVMAGAAHLIMASNAEVQRQDPVPSSNQVAEQYLSLTGGQDTGLNESATLDVWRNQGLFGDNRISAYCPVDPQQITHVHASVAFYGTCMLGVQLPESAQEQFSRNAPWTVEPDSPIMGGHCIVVVAYDPRYLYAVTWGSVVALSYPWFQSYVDEAYCVITQEIAESGDGPTGLNLAALQHDLDVIAS